MKAESMFYLEKFDKARVAYEELRKLDSRYKTAIYRLEICSLLTVSPNKSTKMLEGYSGTQGRRDKFYNYWMALIYFNQGRNLEAIHACERFFVVNQYKTKEIRTEIKDLLKMAELRHSYFQRPLEYKVVHVSGKLNSGHNEYSPVFSESRQSMLFLSSHQRINFKTKTEKFHVFEAEKIDGEWHTPRMIHHLHTFSPVNISINLIHDLEKLYVYTDKEEGHMQYSEFQGHTWSAPQGDEFNLDLSDLTAHFFINEQENLILFSKPVQTTDGVKHLDIFQSNRDSLSGQWIYPKNISKAINSDKDEDFPFLSSDGKTLYFSSKGHSSIGGYDIFKSEFEPATQSWSAPIALRNPINSTEDDIQYKLNENLISGYYVSNRKESKGGFDIYYALELNSALVEGVVTDSEDKAVRGAKIVLNSTQDEKVFIDAITDENGKYKLKANADDEFSVEIWLAGERVHKNTLAVPADTDNTLALVSNYQIELTPEN
ncbi:MAG: PD40 domain-containing protein [Cyclobacteriaceae bacterium]